MSAPTSKRLKSNLSRLLTEISVFIPRRLPAGRDAKSYCRVDDSDHVLDELSSAAMADSPAQPVGDRNAAYAPGASDELLQLSAQASNAQAGPSGITPGTRPTYAGKTIPEDIEISDDEADNNIEGTVNGEDDSPQGAGHQFPNLIKAVNDDLFGDGAYGDMDGHAIKQADLDAATAKIRAAILADKPIRPRSSEEMKVMAMGLARIEIKDSLLLGRVTEEINIICDEFATQQAEGKYTSFSAIPYVRRVKGKVKSAADEFIAKTGRFEGRLPQLHEVLALRYAAAGKMNETVGGLLCLMGKPDLMAVVQGHPVVAVVTSHSAIDSGLISKMKSMVAKGLESADLAGLKEDVRLDHNAMQVLKGKNKALEVRVTGLESSLAKLDNNPAPDARIDDKAVRDLAAEEVQVLATEISAKLKPKFATLAEQVQHSAQQDAKIAELTKQLDELKQAVRVLGKPTPAVDPADVTGDLEIVSSVSGRKGSTKAQKTKAGQTARGANTTAAKPGPATLRPNQPAPVPKRKRSELMDI